MNIIKFCFLLLLITSCVSAHWEKKVYEPIRSGEVSYLIQGSDFIIEKRREDAINKIEKFCALGYTLLEENSKSHAGSYASTLHCIGQDPTTTCIPAQRYTSSRYTYIKFICNHKFKELTQ